MPVVHFETLSRKSVVLHALVIVGADCVKVFSLGKLLKLLLSGVHREHLLDAVVVVTHVVLVLKDAKCTLDLVLKTKVAHPCL